MSSCVPLGRWRVNSERSRAIGLILVGPCVRGASRWIGDHSGPQYLQNIGMCAAIGQDGVNLVRRQFGLDERARFPTQQDRERDRGKRETGSLAASKFPPGASTGPDHCPAGASVSIAPSQPFPDTQPLLKQLITVVQQKDGRPLQVSGEEALANLGLQAVSILHRESVRS